MAGTNEQNFYDKVFPVPERVREKSYIKSSADPAVVDDLVVNRKKIG